MTTQDEIPVGLAYAYLKGSLAALDHNPTESRLKFQLRSARQLFAKATKKNRSFLSRRLEKQAREEGWL